MTEASAVAPFVGQLLDGRYKIVREIASGGMSVVYEATHVKIGRTVAIKVLHRDMAGDPEVVARFLNEARAVGTFGHPNIVASTDFGELPGHVPYLVLEYLEGHTLSQEIQNDGPLPIRRVVRVALQIASALDAAHARNVIHRDLTSANIFLVKREGNPDHVKVLDFGISKFLSASDSAPKTRRGLTMGTPEFMSPEQIADPDSIDSRVDVYALGVIMYQMLSGQCPFTRTPLQSLLTQIVVEPPPPIERQGIPEGLNAIALKALSKNPSERFASMREMGMELEGLSSRIFSGADWNASIDAPAFDSGSRPPGYSGPSGPISGSVSVSSSVSKPVEAAIPTTAPVIAQRGRGLLFATTALALVAVTGMVYLVMRGQRTSAPAPVQQAVLAPTTIPPPAPPLVEAPVRVQVASSTPQARVTLRGRTHLLPYTQELKPGSQPETIEVTSPGREGRRFWITLDHPVALDVELAEGHGMIEATAEQTVIALGGKPVDGAPPAVDAASAKVPVGAHRAGSHRHPPAGLTLAKGAAPAAVERPASEAPAEPRVSPALAKTEPLPAAPKSVVSPGESKSDATATPKVASVAPVTKPSAVPMRGLDPVKTQAFVKGRLPEVQRCYERGRMDEPDLKGRVTLRISVSETGGVTSAMVEVSSLHSSSVEGCIVNLVKAWRFPAPTGGPAVISYPFNFR